MAQTTFFLAEKLLTKQNCVVCRVSNFFLLSFEPDTSECTLFSYQYLYVYILY
jgi:hypothetical protein